MDFNLMVTITFSIFCAVMIFIIIGATFEVTIERWWRNSVKQRMLRRIEKQEDVLFQLRKKEIQLRNRETSTEQMEMLQEELHYAEKKLRGLRVAYEIYNNKYWT